MSPLIDVWARQVTSWEEIPGPFRSFVAAGRPLPYLIYSPPDSWGSRKVNARLTLLSDKGVTVLENTAEGVSRSEWLFAEIDYVEQGAVHLYSWLRLGGVVDGKPAAVQVEYNAVVAPLFTQLVQAVRRKWTGTGSAQLAPEQAKLAGWAAVDYKLWTYARESLLSGEQVLGQVYQPEVRIPWLLFFRRRLIPAYVGVLTDTELICVSDDESDENTGRYGTVHRYIPLKKIKDWQLLPVTDDKPGVWRLQLPAGSIDRYFSSQVQASLEKLAVCCRECGERLGNSSDGF